MSENKAQSISGAEEEEEQLDREQRLRRCYGTYVQAPVPSWALLGTRDLQVNVIYLLGHDRLFKFRLWEGYHIAFTAGQWEQDGQTVRLRGVTETILSDSVPFERFEPYEATFTTRLDDGDLALVREGALSDGSLWRTTYQFAGYNTIISPQPFMYPPAMFPQTRDQVVGCLEGLLKRAEDEGVEVPSVGRRGW